MDARSNRIGMLAVAALGAGAAAQPHLDIQLINDGSGQIKSGLVDVAQIDEDNLCPILDDDFRVFTQRLDDGSIPHFENFPGFNACRDTFEEGSFVGFNIVDALRRWDGEDFDQIPDNETMFVSSGGGNPVIRQTPSEPGGFVEGFDLALIPDSGSMHTHVQYFLSADEGEPAPGVYMLTIEVDTTQSGLEPTPPIFLIFADGAPDSELEEAADFIRDRIACAPDLTGPGGDGEPDGGVTADDFFFYLALFASSDPAADLTGPGGDGEPDGSVTADDFFFYLGLFAAGCS